MGATGETDGDVMNEPIADEFYLSLFERATTTFLAERARLADVDADPAGRIEAILTDRDGTLGLPSSDVAALLTLVRSDPDPVLRRRVLEAAGRLRLATYGDDVATMVPIEVTSYCQSSCKFCGWRADNRDMTRLSITETAIREQAKILAEQGFSHFEIAGGDDLKFLKNDLESLIRGLKEETTAINPAARVSLCLVPLMESQYAKLHDAGLDCVLTWQETYDKELFDFHIPTGPKAWGIDENFAITRGGNGYLQRLKSQEMAVRCGMQAGLGAMIGLSPVTEADVMSVVEHGQKLLTHYADTIEPLIIGMPAWNSITTSKTDNRDGLGFDFDAEANFELIAAIYLLAFPDRHAWVFANGRVSPDVQTSTVRTAACFTSTCVQIAPGAYLDIDAQMDASARRKMFVRSSVDTDLLTHERVMAGEQFVHYYLTHADFLELFAAQGLDVVNDRELLAH